MDDYLLIKYFKCSTTQEEEEAIAGWLADDPDGLHKKQYNQAHMLFDGMTVYGDTSRTGKTSNVIRFVTGLCSAAAVVVFMIFGTYFLTRQHTINELSARMEKIRVPAGKSMQMVLEDGTEVWLNAGTEIEYPAVFSNKERKIKVNGGEVLLDVARDEDRPFIVDTYASEISVLGTKFDVVVDEDRNDFSLSLIRGSVKVSNKFHEGEECILKPNDIVKLVDNHLYVDKIRNVGNVGCWTKGIIDVAGLSFEEIIRKFEVAYDVEIKVVSKNVPVVEYSRAKFRVSEGIDHALKMLAMVADFTYTRDYASNTITIR